MATLAAASYHTNRDKTRKERPCITCRRPFLSEWIGNRMCVTCKNNDGFIALETAEQIRERVL